MISMLQFDFVHKYIHTSQRHRFVMGPNGPFYNFLLSLFWVIASLPALLQ